MKITVLLFANLREKAGARQLTLDVSSDMCVRDLKNLLESQYPAISPALKTVLVAVNQEYAFDEDIIPADAEIGLFPPVSGGSRPHVYIDIVDDQIDFNKVITEMTLKTTGAVCVFSGIVRGSTQRGNSHETTYLEYEVYKPMALAKMQQVANEIADKWPIIENIYMVQRIGRLEPLTPTIVIACSAAHRDTGIFDASHYGIDRLKEIVPIWKKEVGPGGETWVEGDYIPTRED